MEASVNVNKYEDKENFQKSFQVLFLSRESPRKSDYWNWAASFQSYLEGKTVIFKTTKIIEGAEAFMTKQASGK